MSKLRIALGLGALAIAGVLLVVSGVIPLQASSGHWAITAWFLNFAKQRSVATHSAGIDPPPLDDRRLVVIGAGHYESGCRPCHGAPGMAPPLFTDKMLPKPPDLGQISDKYDDAALFSIVLHGLKFTGMPAWPAPQRDDEVWSLVAFMKELPALDAAGYQRLVTGEPATRAGTPAVVRARCARCHGADGLGRRERAFPRLAGQRAGYLRQALEAYARGSRHSGIMQPIAAPLSPDQIEAIATWYERQPLPAASSGGSLRGAAIARAGIPERKIPACAKCHGPGGEPKNPVYPRLAGQHAHYIEQQLGLFTQRRRGGGPYGEIMHVVTEHALWPDEVREVALHYASLAPSP